MHPFSDFELWTQSSLASNQCVSMSVRNCWSVNFLRGWLTRQIDTWRAKLFCSNCPQCSTFPDTFLVQITLEIWPIFLNMKEDQKNPSIFAFAPIDWMKKRSSLKFVPTPSKFFAYWGSNLNGLLMIFIATLLFKWNGRPLH